MAHFRKQIVFLGVIAASFAATAKAQYYELANQIPQMIQPALSGSFNYRGFAEASFTGGLGTNSVNSLEFSTTQGFKYSNWFFMGVGAGVNVLFSNYKDSDRPDGYNPDYRPSGGNFNSSYDRNDTGVLIPLYSDFRFNIGQESNVGFFIDVRLGASFLVGKSYMNTPDGILNNSEGFYLRPSVGLRIPTNNKDTRQAINIGVTYQLITNNYWNWNWYYNSTTLNSLGASISYEW